MSRTIPTAEITLTVCCLCGKPTDKPHTQKTCGKARGWDWTVPDVQPEVAALYETDPAGCCLRVVFAGGDVEDHYVIYCLETAKVSGHEKCIALAEKLLCMSKTQRNKLAYGAGR